jgi:hypothetical protein
MTMRNSVQVLMGFFAKWPILHIKSNKKNSMPFFKNIYIYIYIYIYMKLSLMKFYGIKIFFFFIKKSIKILHHRTYDSEKLYELTKIDKTCLDRKRRSNLRLKRLNLNLDLYLQTKFKIICPKWRSVESTKCCSALFWYKVITQGAGSNFTNYF